MEHRHGHDKIRLDGSLAFITDGGRGIGFATAEALAEAGARVVLAGKDESALQAAVETLRRAGHYASHVLLGIKQSAACTETSERINRDVGAVDILIANAGIAWSDTPAEDMSDETWNHVLDVNLSGTFWTCRAFGKPMLDRQKGSDRDRGIDIRSDLEQATETGPVQCFKRRPSPFNKIACRGMG